MEVKEPDLTGTYSYADYLTWQFEVQVELIKGRIYKMSPAPRRLHQKVSGFVFSQIYNCLTGKKCEVYSAPFDVRLPRKSKEDKDIITVVQPDICVICDPSKLDDKGCIGAPDIVVEILSPGNNKKELKNKYEVYEEAGIKEYWIIHPDEKTFFRYTLNDAGKYESSRLLTFGDVVTTAILPGFTLTLDELFAYE